VHLSGEVCQLENVIEVMFSVAATVDSHFSPSQHADDMIAMAKRIFSGAAVNVVSVKMFEKGLETILPDSEPRGAAKTKRNPRSNG
jgi:hypothetical protein